LCDETITIKTILFDGHVAGFVASYTDEEVEECILRLEASEASDVTNVENE
jgi:hypothetical protein